MSRSPNRCETQEAKQLEFTTTCPELSVVIAAWNSWRFLPSCLASVCADDSVRQEIIVVDNGSTDGTVSHLSDHYSSVTVVRNARNEGHSRAINRGIRSARGKYVLVLDADTVVSPGVTKQLIEFMRRHSDVVIAAPKMLNGDGTVQESARSFPKPINALFGRQTFLASLFPNNKFTRDYVCRQKTDEVEPYEVEWVSSACMIFSRQLAERIGPWDEGFKGYWVEADWCKQAHAAGKIYCVPMARVTHFYQNRAGKKKGASRIIDFHYGAHRFYWKHYTRGPFDPRSIIAALALALRAAPLILGDFFRRPEEKKAQSGEFVPAGSPAKRAEH
jgi:N-acetylglucosaminyl-diphospho-decaprenol L-rhamnosyltransferase